MPFTKEQTEEIKEQLLKQIEKLPNENKEQIKEYIKNLNEQQLEEFLKQNKIQLSESGQAVSEQVSEKPIFESIIKGEIPSYKIAENTKAIAILEINPLSKAHSLIIPKQKITIEKLPKSAFSLAQKIAKKIKIKLKPDEIKIETFSLQDYPAINVIPIYKNIPLKKYKASDEEIKEMQKKLQTKKRSLRKIPESSKSPKKILEISFRIP